MVPPVIWKFAIVYVVAVLVLVHSLCKAAKDQDAKVWESTREATRWP